MSKSQYDSYEQYEDYNKFLKDGKCVGDLKMINNEGDYVLYYFTIEPCGEDEDVVNIKSIKPYLRPMSSMTDDEKKEYVNFFEDIDGYVYSIDATIEIDWLNAHHFDYRGLIEKGLALPAPEGMYN